ncbi:MAG: histidinol-phosphate transaminase [Dehalococcoidales bacterium]|nr:histidinol-phosphate transaminase [Dehalococcoidales bacterium]
MVWPKPGIEDLVAASHGGINYAELEKLGISPESIIDFSVSTNPFGPPPGIEKALSKASIDCYPDSESTEFRRALSEKLNISPDNLLIGSGSTELIRMTAAVYFGPSDTVLIPQPTYGEYEISSRLVGARVIKQQMKEETGFRLDVVETAALVRRYRPKGIFLCNPNNPTGGYLPEKEFREVLSIGGDSLVILDEAYASFVSEGWSTLGLVEQNNLIVIRSMTKDYALAGLRLGYLVAAKQVISALRKVKPPWNVSSVAQQAGIQALNSGEYIETCRTRILEARQFLVEELEKIGLKPLPSQANFFLVRTGDAARFRCALLRKGILVRDCSSFGLPQYIRLAPRSIDECRKLISAIMGSGVLDHDS